MSVFTTNQCLIATATYGSPSADEVQFLRRYRDNVLKRSSTGRSILDLFERFYYSFSPQLAKRIAGRRKIRYLTRIFVTDPIVSIFLLLSLFSSRGRGSFASSNAPDTTMGVIFRGIGGLTYSISWLVWNILLALALFNPSYLLLALALSMPMILGLGLTRLGSWMHRSVDFEHISPI